MAVYAAAKAFLLSFSLALEVELEMATRVDRVLTVVLAGTRTGFQTAAGVKVNPREKLLSPDRVGAEVLHALDRRRKLVFIGGRSRAMSILASLLPLYQQAKLWGRLMRNLR